MNTFDTLSYARKLKAAGFTEQQAEAQADALREVIIPELATRQDLKDLGNELRTEMQALEQRLTIRMGAMLAASTALTVSILSLVMVLA